MDRRDFVRKSTIGMSGAAAAGGGGLSKSAMRGGSLFYAMPDYLDQVDRGLARIDHWTVTDTVPGFAGDVDATDRLGRKILRSLYMTAMFKDLEVEDQVHPGMQERLRAVEQEMDEAFLEVDSLLDSQTPASWSRIRENLANDPDIAERLAGMFEVEGARTGVQDERREQTRRSIEQIRGRLVTQSPDLLLDEYRTKVEKLESTDVRSAAYQKWIRSKVSERVFWQEAQESRSLREERISRGLRRMGIGLLWGLGGAVLIVTGVDALIAAGAIAVTVGSIMLLWGFLVLLYGAMTSGSEMAESGS